jgi:hypothetical protein
MHQLASHVVARAAAARHGRVWQDAIHHLLGYNLPPIVSCNINADAAGSSADYVFAYRRTPGARALAVVVELREPSSDAAECTILLERVAGGTHYLPDDAAANGNLRDLVPHSQPTGNWADPRQIIDVLDVSGLTVGALEWIRVRWTDSVTAPGTRGIARIHAFEVPRATLATDASDAGIDGGWPFAGNPLHDGTSSTLDGFERLLAEVDRARSLVRRHHQLVTIESTSDAWPCGSSVGGWAPVRFGRSTQPTFRLRARRLYDASVDNLHSLVCRYTTQHAKDGAQLRMTATSRGTGTVRSATLTLPPSTTFAASGTVAALIPCDGTDQEVDVVFDYQTTGAANLMLSTVDVIENES